jgi:hypothetical protein
VDEPATDEQKADHLICGTGWALLGAVACAYFGYRTYADIRATDYAWSHNSWTVVTWAVWVVLAAGLASETRCLRERLLFGLLFAQFMLGGIFSLWGSASFNVTRDARWASMALWGFAALMSAVALVSRRGASENQTGAAG